MKNKMEIEILTPEIFTTKVTRLGNGLYGCRIIDLKTNNWIVEARVPKRHIGGAIKTLLRSFDKMGYPSPMAHASRFRSSTQYYTNFKFIWNEKNDKT